MKKMMKFFAAAFVAIVAVSCVKEIINNGQASDVKMVDVTFGASVEDLDTESKAHVGYNGNTPVMHWTAGDKVAVVDANTGSIYEFTLREGENTSNGVFAGQIPEDALNAQDQEWCLVYPFASVEKFISKGTRHVLETVLPVEQKAVNNGIMEGANLLVCASSTLNTPQTEIKMFPIGNFIKVDIAGNGITSLTVFNNENRSVTGLQRPNIANSSMSVTNSYLNPSGSNRFSNKVVLLPSEGNETILPGTYYLVVREEFEKGMTLKFTNSEGKVAFYSSSSDNGLSNRNKTIYVKYSQASPAWDAANLNWKNEEKVVLDFSSQPFTENLPTTKNTAINGTYTLTSANRQVKISTAGSDYEAFTPSTTRGLLFDNAGDYIEFPAVPGKRLKEVQVTTAYKSSLSANVTDENGVDMDGDYVAALYASNMYSYILPRAEINTKYRYVIQSASAKLIHIQKITLIYVGDDVAEIAGVNADVTNSYSGFTVEGELLGGGLDAASWGIEYGTSADALTEVATGNGGVINQFVEAAAGIYYVRVWASADGGVNKTYSDVQTVEVKPFSGAITFDFSSEATVRQNIKYVGTTDTKTPATATNIIANRQFKHEETGISDYFTYATADGVFPFTMLSYIDPTGVDSNNNPVTTGYQLYDGTYASFRVHVCGYKNSVFMSIPKVDGYRLSKTTFYSLTNDARGHVCTSAIVYDKDQIGTASGSTVIDENGYYVYTMDFTGKKNTADDQCWLIYSKNRWNKKIVFEYEKVVE